jgi:hypothetical protein
MEDIHTLIIGAIQSVRSQIRWKPGSAARHLLKRKLRGHLSADATLDDYERIILTVLEDTRAEVYLYRHRDVAYVAIAAVVQSRHWLVMFSMDGLIETAYVIEHPGRYLSKPVFDLVGPLGEVIA